MNRTCKTCATEFAPTHGRQAYCTPECRQPSHAKIIMTCHCCGGEALKERRAQRYSGVYCSQMCRDYHQHGASTCTVPADHWARWYGKSSAWAPALTRNDGTCQWCGEPNDRSTTAAYCTDQCKTRAKAQRRRAREHNALGEYRYRDVVAQYIAQGRVCAYCQHPCPGLPDAEHVHPLSKGGRNDMTNIVAACQPCNSDKRDLTLSEWAADRQRRGLKPVNTTLTGSRYARYIEHQDSNNYSLAA